MERCASQCRLAQIGAVQIGSSLGLHSDKIDGGKLFGSDYAYHGTLCSIYSQANATQRLLLSWIALGLTIIGLTCLIGSIVKMKDVRGERMTTSPRTPPACRKPPLPY